MPWPVIWPHLSQPHMAQCPVVVMVIVEVIGSCQELSKVANLEMHDP